MMSALTVTVSQNGMYENLWRFKKRRLKSLATFYKRRIPKTAAVSATKVINAVFIL